MILVFSGSGISKASGIDTFLDQPDLRDKLHRSYANRNPQSYKQTIESLLDVSEQAQPNDAHNVLVEYEIPVITMNIDGLHERAGSDVIALHGVLPSRDEISIAHSLKNQPVLYGDPAPNYQLAINKVTSLSQNDLFIVVGASSYTSIADELRYIARLQGASIIEIQSNAEQRVREVIEEHLHLLEDN